MPRNTGGKYQYETSPRKLEPDYTRPKRNKKSPKKSSVRKPQTDKNKKKITSSELGAKKLKRRTVLYIILGFLIVFGISYRNSQIDANFVKLQDMKEKLAIIQKENSQMQVKVENSLNLKKLEEQAKELLGMQKLTPKQTIYVNLPKTDYIEPATEKVVIDKENMLQGIINKVTNIFK